MNKNNISIATITLARDEKEEQLIRESLEQLSTLHIPVFITDGGSLPGFLEFLRSIPHFIVSKAKVQSVWQQAKNSVSEAYQSGSDFIFYTEPDKHDFFYQLPEIINNLQPNDKSGVIMASRSAAGFATFPAFQQMTETTINICCAEIIGSSFDYTYGPFLLNRQLAPHLKLVHQDIGWGWRPYTFGIAKRLGFNVESYIDNFCCPPQQQQDTAAERIYRMRQLNQNIQGLVLSESVEIKR